MLQDGSKVTMDRSWPILTMPENVAGLDKDRARSLFKSTVAMTCVIPVQLEQTEGLQLGVRTPTVADDKHKGKSNPRERQLVSSYAAVIEAGAGLCIMDPMLDRVVDVDFDSCIFPAMHAHPHLASCRLTPGGRPLQRKSVTDSLN
jgi:hypothetical protein